jgi:hypothetical protein
VKYTSIIPFYAKLNYNCPEDEKTGKGLGSCVVQKETDKTAKPVDKQTKPVMDHNDILKRIQTGGKITPEEHAYIKDRLAATEKPAKEAPPHVTELKTAIEKVKAEEKSGKVTPESMKALKTSVEKAKSVTMQNAPPNPAVGRLLGQTEQVWHQLNTDQRNALQDYSTTGYTAINRYLRTGEVNPRNQSDADKEVKKLDSVFEKASLPENFTVYRGIDESVINAMKDNLKVGAEFALLGFTSTTYDEKIANNFSRGNKKTAIIEIDLPKGAKALAIENHTQLKAEREVLLDRGMKFKVTEVKIRNIHGGAFSKMHIKVEAQ